jgi:uncharacterized repeat protein (TIGR01451 family)
MYRGRFYRIIGLLIAIDVLSGAFAQAPAGSIAVTSIAEVERSNKLVPADRIVSGDMVIYTLEVRNTAPATAPPPIVIFPVPEHMIYLADSAVGPGTEVSYSVDGGHSFDSPENLHIKEAGEPARPAAAADYTHIRWQLKNALKSNSVAFVRFRALAK